MEMCKKMEQSCSVYGLNWFSEYTEGFENCYAVIGGATCDIILSNADLNCGDRNKTF